MNNVCLLDQFKQGQSLKIRKGDELKIVTKSGRTFKGILFDFKEGYIHTIEMLGILVIFPINSLTSIHLT